LDVVDRWLEERRNCVTGKRSDEAENGVVPVMATPVLRQQAS
jgi:hypothetical protein